MKHRILILFSIFLLLWSLLLIRALRLQVVPDQRLSQLKRRQFETSIQLRSRRGLILDRQGRELAASIPAYSLFADPKLIENPSAVADRLAKTLRMSRRGLYRLLKQKEKRFVWLRRQLDEKAKQKISSWGNMGLGFIEEPQRVYPHGGSLQHILGLVGRDGRGLEGIELQLNSHLEGRVQQVILPKDARGRPLLQDGRALTEVPDGYDVQMTLDQDIQFQLERELTDAVEKFKADGAQGLIMDAINSEVLAIASLPLARRNRLISDVFEPGSTFKTFVVASALKQGVIQPNSRYDCENGRMKIGRRWISEADSHHKFKVLSVSEILALSSNIGTAKIAFDIGARGLEAGLREFGFGERLGVEFPGEARGIVNPQPWSKHLLSNVSFGQGVAVTPIQVAAAYAAIANGGWLQAPRLVSEIRGRDGKTEWEPRGIRRRVLSEEQAATMRLMLTAATQEGGTGVNARVPGYHVAGKTGTAQIPDNKNGGYLTDSYISSFAGFLPAHEPRFVIFVMVENPKKAYYGSQVAAPIFARLGQFLMRHAGVPPIVISERNLIPKSNTEEKLRDRAQGLALRAANESEHGLPNLLGMSLREALARLDAMPVKARVKGHGIVVRTIPQAGTLLPQNRPARVTLLLENPD